MKNKVRFFTILLTILLVSVVALAVISCDNGSSGGGKTEILPTLTKVKVIPDIYGHNGDEESDVCLTLNGGVVEKFSLEITISNPDKNEVVSFNYNDIVYSADRFSIDSTPSVIYVNNLTAPVKEGEFEIKIDEIIYVPKKGGTAKISNLEGNVKKVKIQPTFTLTLDYSSANLQEGEEPVKVLENDFMAHFNLPPSSDMNDSETNDITKHVYGWNGYIFDGWYTEKDGKGTKYNNLDAYSLYKDVTLYAHYARAFKYTKGETEITITGLTKEGLNTSFNVDIPSEIEGLPVRKISAQAFAGACTGKTVILPQTMVEIGDYAFANCTGLKIDLGSTEKIGDMAFSNCGLMVLGKEGLFLLGEASLPSTLKEIGESAFRGCSWLTRSKNPYRDGMFRPEDPTLMLPASLEKIGDYAFLESGFHAVYFHADSNITQENFGIGVFEGSKKLSAIYTSYAHTTSGPQITTSGKSGIEVIPQNTFYNCTALKNSLSSITIKLNEGIKSIGELAFASSSTGMTELTYITFPDSLEEIGVQAFANTALNRVEFKKTSNLKTLGDYCFENSDFEEISIYSLTTYGKSPFWGNTNIKAINLLCYNVPTYVAPTLLEGGTGLTRKTKYYVRSGLLNAYRSKTSSWASDDTQDYICSYDHIATDTSGLKLCFEPINAVTGELDPQSTDVRITSIFDTSREIRVPKEIYFNDVYYNVVSVGKYFVHDQITKVRLPHTLVRIEERAFYTCKTLYECLWVNASGNDLTRDKNKDVSLTYIGANAFNNTALTYFYSNTKLEVIGEQAFHNCPNLKNVVLDNCTQLDIMASAFSQSGIEYLAIGFNVERIYNAVFQGNDKLNVVLIRLENLPFAGQDKYGNDEYPLFSPLGYCPNISKVYLFSNNALNNFTASKTPNGQNNVWANIKDVSGNSKYEIYSGSWEEALDHYNL